MSSQQPVGLTDILEYIEMKLPIGSQDRELFTGLLDLNWPWLSLGQHTRKKVKCWLGKKHMAT